MTAPTVEGNVNSTAKEFKRTSLTFIAHLVMTTNKTPTNKNGCPYYAASTQSLTVEPFAESRTIQMILITAEGHITSEITGSQGASLNGNKNMKPEVHVLILA